MGDLTNVQSTEQQENVPAATQQEESAKSFSQDDVNRIVQERLARDRERINSMINEDESIKRELQSSRLKLSAAAQLSEKGYPHILLDLADCSDEKSFKESMNKIEAVYEAAYKEAVNVIFRENGREPGGCGSGVYSNIGSDKVRDAFRP